MPDAYVTGKATLVTYDKAKDAFYVNPEEFGRKVIEVITKDFGAYEGAGSPFHPLPVVTKHGYSGWPMS